MPLKKHRLDRAPVFLLSLRPSDGALAGSTAAFAFLDPYTHETKISSALFYAYGRVPSEQPLHTFVKFDGDKAWGVDGVSRTQFDMLETLRREGRVEGAELTTYGEVRQRLYDIARGMIDDRQPAGPGIG